MRKQSTNPVPTMRHQGMLLAATMLVALLVSGPPPRAQPTCDCSCEAFGEMQRFAEEARAAAESGNFTDIPEGAAEMGRCAGQCALQWAQCANPDAAPARPPARISPNGASSPEALLQQLQQGRQQPAEPAAPGLPKDRLTADYLDGMWCSIYGGQETTQWRFDELGRYEIGVPAGGGFAMQGNKMSLDDFLEGFDRLIAVEPDTFTTERVTGRVARENVFTRGPCD